MTGMFKIRSGKGGGHEVAPLSNLRSFHLFTAWFVFSSLQRSESVEFLTHNPP